MSLLTVLQAGVKVANKVTRPLQSTITFERDMGNDARGARTFGLKTPLHAIVDDKVTMVRTREGVLTATRSVATLLDIAEIVAATAGKGIAINDRITLQDGSVSPILGLAGFIDAGTGHPIATTLMLG